MLLPRASDLEEEPTIDWNKVLDNMQGTPLNVKFKLAVCPSGLRTVLAMGYSLLPFIQSDVLYGSMYYRALLLGPYIFMSIIESSISTLSMPVYAYNYTRLWF